MSIGTEPIDDDELLYRRVPVIWYDRENLILDPQTFGPHKENDATGISMSRARYKSAEEAGKGRPGKSYFVAELRADDLRKNGIQVVPRPRDDDPGHAEAPEINSGNRRDTITLERQKLLATLVRMIHGPFETPV